MISENKSASEIRALFADDEANFTDGLEQEAWDGPRRRSTTQPTNPKRKGDRGAAPGTYFNNRYGT